MAVNPPTGGSRGPPPGTLHVCHSDRLWDIPPVPLRLSSASSRGFDGSHRSGETNTEHGMCQQSLRQLTGLPGEARAERQAHVSVECLWTLQTGAAAPGSAPVLGCLVKPRLGRDTPAGEALSRSREFE